MNGLTIENPAALMDSHTRSVAIGRPQAGQDRRTTVNWKPGTASTRSRQR
jgi:hypothetical protein